MSFWSELKRRNVYKVAVAYAIVAWLILQVASITFPALHLPGWALTLLTVFIIVGFPLVLIFAWAFEITPEGLKLTKDVPKHESITHITGQRLNYILIGVIVLAVAYILFDNFYLDKLAIQTEVASQIAELVPPTVDEEEALPATPTVEEEDARKTIAVLPFVNMSSDPEQDYFADGLTEEILNSLAQIPDLSVTGRTSSFTFKDSNKKTPEIADDLGVENILEGSVRKSGNDLRITTQLLRGADGFHLWSKTYDRKLEDIFAVQEDIATTVANELKVKLGVGESLKQLGATENVEAYELYLNAKGKLTDVRPEEQYGLASESLELIDAAIALDHQFALAWQLKAGALWYMEGYDEALQATLKAIELDPYLAEAYSFLAYLRFGEGKFVEAELTYQKAAELSSAPLGAMSEYIVFLQSVGYLERALGSAEVTLRNDPFNKDIRCFLIEIYGRLGNLQRAEDEYERAITITGDNYNYDRVITQARLLSGTIVTNENIMDIDRVFVELKEYVESPKKGLAELRRLYNDDDYQDNPSQISIWMWAAYFGDPEFAMEILEKTHTLNDIVWYPAMKQVRQLPRFKELVREKGLVDYWNQFGYPDLCHETDDGDFECD